MRTNKQQHQQMNKLEHECDLEYKNELILQLEEKEKIMDEISLELSEFDFLVTHGMSVEMYRFLVEEEYYKSVEQEKDSL